MADFKQGIEYHNKHLNIAKELRQRDEEGRAYGNRGTAYRDMGDFKEAIKDHSQHLSISKELRDRAAEGVAYCNLGNDYQSLGDFKQAIEYHRQHLTIVKELGDRAGQGVAYGNLGIVCQCLGNFKQGIEYHNEHLNIAKELGQRDGEGRAYGNRGTAYRYMGDFKEAIKDHSQHLSIAKELKDRAADGAAYCNLGNDYQSLGDFKQATEYHNEHLSIAKELGQRDGEGRAYGNLGNTYQSLGDFKQAIVHHNENLGIAKELGDRAAEGTAYGNLGCAFQSLGDLKQAIEYHNQHLSIAKALGQKHGEGRAYANLGNVYNSLGYYKQAIEYQNQRLSITKELGQRGGEGSAYSNLGNAYYNLGDFKQATEYHNQHLSIAIELGDNAGKGAAYCNLGNVYQTLGDFKHAKEYHDQHLSVAKKLGQRDGEGRAYGNLGVVCQSLGDHKQAIEYQNQFLSIAKELGDRAGEGRAYGSLGNTYRLLGDFKHALQYHNQQLSIAKQLGDRAGEGSACYSLGDDLEFSGSLQEALGYYQSSVKLYNEMRFLLLSEDVWKITFRNACQDVYTALWRTLVRLQRTDQALLVAERGRAQALVDLMKLQYHSQFSTPEAFVPKKAISDITTDMRTQTVFLALEGATINLWLLKGEDVHFEKKTIEDATLLVKKAFEEIGVCVHVKCENRSLDEQDGDLPLDNESSQGADGCKNSSLRLLFDSIISPVANKLEGDELIIVPDGPLCLVPYAACVDKASRYLSESTRIRILPSLTSLKMITDCPEDYHNKTGALLVGNPCVEEIKRKRGKRFRPSCLPRAEEEVMILGEILHTKPLTGREATKDEVLRRMSSVALVHIAAHGDMEAGEIALAPNPNRTSKIPNDKDFLLTMSVVQAVHLREKLVVLSCCHSAQGKVKAEGVVGIGRAFLGAGARSVLVSLWAINDEATMEFMKIFYNHLGGGCSASVALHRAMKCLRESEKFGDVKYWAPFVLIGDDVTIDFGEKKSEHSE